VIQAIRAGRLRSPQALASFILGTAHNVIRESLKRGRRTEQLVEQEMEEVGSYSEMFLDSGAKLAIEMVIRRLKPREQKFLRLYYYEELPKEEIARRLGIKEERLRLLKSRTLKRFREIYERLVK
jgi:RNA polymerase sigma factor (sigma-70 family)